MGNACIIRKVPFKTSNRIVWGLILSEREGVALMILQRTENTRAHALVVGIEGTNGIFTETTMNRFPFEHGDMAMVGETLCSLGSKFDEDNFFKFLKSGSGDWWRDDS